MEPCMLYVTAADAAEAEKIGRTLVAERLAACANLLGPIRSFYWWEGVVQEGAEVALLLKTRPDRAEAACRRVVELHSYECPCVVQWPIVGGHPPFLQWIREETAGG